MEFKEFYARRYQGKRIAILGFGREGQSSYRWLRQMGVAYRRKLSLARTLAGGASQRSCGTRPVSSGISNGA